MKGWSCLLIVSSLVFITLSERQRKPLNKFIRHYEPLNYAESDIREAFKNGLNTKFLDFKAHGREFKLRLEPDGDTFHPGLYTNKRVNDQVKDHVNSALAGYLEDEPDSEAFGSIRNGIFEGTIFAKDGEYTVRPANAYFDKPQDFHSVIFRAEDEDESVRRKRNIFSDIKYRSKRRRRETNEFDEPDDFNLYDQKVINDQRLRVCNISMEADYLFTEAWGNDTGRAIGEMVYLVRLANRKFAKMAEDPYWATHAPFNVRLMIGFITAYTYYTTPKELRPPSMGLATFLDFVSDRNYEEYCQAFFFTYRDFEGGLTGLSWGPSDGRNQSDDQGGICEYRRYFILNYENFNVRKLKSYNSAVISYKFFGKMAPPKVAELAFLRQVGRAFGAPFDPPECQPDPIINGTYIMSNSASIGGRKNNDKFSPCSIRAIVATLKSSKVDRPVRADANEFFELKCLETPKKITDRRPRCGDTVRQNQEQCDCGTPEQCKLNDPGECCEPLTCKLKAGSYCSVNDGPCCDPKTCSHRSSNYLCRPGDECAHPSRCRNLRGFDNYQCPGRGKKWDLKPCATQSQVCIDGICSNSVCRRYGLTECQCSSKKYECYVCCNFLGRCVPALNIPQVTGFRKPTLPTGAPCLNDTGFCDLFHVCLRVDYRKPLSDIGDLYFKREDVKTITRKYWWAIMLGAMLWVVFIVLLIFCLRKVTPTSIPQRDRRGDMPLIDRNGK